MQEDKVLVWPDIVEWAGKKNQLECYAIHRCMRLIDPHNWGVTSKQIAEYMGRSRHSTRHWLDKGRDIWWTKREGKYYYYAHTTLLNRAKPTGKRQERRAVPLVAFRRCPESQLYACIHPYSNYRPQSRDTIKRRSGISKHMQRKYEEDGMVTIKTAYLDTSFKEDDTCTWPDRGYFLHPNGHWVKRLGNEYCSYVPPAGYGNASRLGPETKRNGSRKKDATKRPTPQITQRYYTGKEAMKMPDVTVSVPCIPEEVSGPICVQIRQGFYEARPPAKYRGHPQEKAPEMEIIFPF